LYSDDQESRCMMCNVFVGPRRTRLRESIAAICDLHMSRWAVRARVGPRHVSAVDYLGGATSVVDQRRWNLVSVFAMLPLVATTVNML